MSSPNYRAWLKAQTELNAEGNEWRGREGEDLMYESANPLERPFEVAPMHHDSRKITDEQWIEVLKALNGK